MINNNILNFNFNNDKINTIQKAKNILEFNNIQNGGKYLEENIHDEETHFISDNYVAKSKLLNGGYGVFANRDYKKGDIVEMNVFLEHLDNGSGLHNYVHASHLNKDKSLIVLGNGSIFNHQDDNNIDFYYINGKNFFSYITNKDIKKDEEMFINYGENYNYTW